MDRQTQTVDIYTILKPVFFLSKVIGLSPYSAVGYIGNRRIIVTVSAIIHSIGMFILNVGLFAYGLVPAMFTWENICSTTESFIFFQTLCVAVSAYFTCLFGCRQTARQFEKLNNLVGKTYYTVWRKDLQLLLAKQILCVIMIVTAGVWEISQTISQFYDFQTVLVLTLYCLTEHAGFMSEHQFVAFMHVLKRTVQKWNNHIDAMSVNYDVINDPLYRNEIKIRKSVLFTVSNNSVTSKREKIHSKLMQFKQLRELHASACDIAESVNAVYSPMLLLSVAKLFISITHTMYYIIVSYIVHDTRLACYNTGNIAYFLWLIHDLLRLTWLVLFTAFTDKEVSHNVQYCILLDNNQSTNVQYCNLLDNNQPTNVQIVSVLSVFLISSGKSPYVSVTPKMLHFAVKIKYFAYW